MSGAAKSHNNNLRAARDLRAMTQQQVADAVGITLNAYQNYEYGKRDIRSSILARLAKVLDVTSDYLLGIDPEPRHLPSTPPGRRMLPVATYETKIDSSGQPIGCNREQEVTNSLYQSHELAWWYLVASHSMDRIIPSGSVVLVDPKAEVRSGDVAAIVVGGGSPIVRCVFFEGSSVRLGCESHDTDFHDELFCADDLRIVGRVVSLSSLDPWRI